MHSSSTDRGRRTALAGRPRGRWAAWTLAAALCGAAWAAQAAAPSAAHAQRVDINTPHQGGRPLQLDLHGGFTWWGVGAATGVRIGIPLMPNGFIDSINNAVYLNFGADFYWMRWRRCGGGRDCWDYSAGLGLPVTLHWEFYFNDQWSAFVELGFQVFIHPRFWNDNAFDVVGEHWFVGQIGGSFHVNEWFLLTLRVGTPYVAFGVTFEIG